MKKTSVAALVIALVSSSAFGADPGATGIDRLVACADVRDAKARLACFDREIAPMAKARTAGTVPGTPAASPPPPPPSARAAAPAAPATSAPAGASAAPTFGQEQLGGKARPAARAEDQVMHGTITSIQKVNTGAWLVSLDNGQAWRHEDETLGAYLKEGEAITIRKGSLGSYRLTRDAGESKNWIRVTRVR